MFARVQRLNVVFSGNDEYLTASVGVASGPEMKVVILFQEVPYETCMGVNLQMVNVCKF